MVANFAIVNPSAAATFKAYRADMSPPLSAFPYTSNPVTSVMATIPLDSAGQLKFSLSSGQADLVVDVVGYYSSGTDGTQFTPSAFRTLGATSIGPRATLNVQVGGMGNVGASRVTDAILHVAVVPGATGGYLNVFSADEDEPATGLLNYDARTVSNSITSTLSDDGAVAIVNHGSSSVTVVVDVEGWFAPPSVLPANSSGAGDGPTATFTPDPEEVAEINSDKTSAASSLASADAAYNAPGGYSRPLNCEQPGDDLYCESLTLGVTHSGQKRNFWCGNTVGVMILRFLVAGRSNASNQIITQGHVASAEHMQTNQIGSTPWSTGAFRRGMNKWVGGKHWKQLNSPTVNEFRSFIFSESEQRQPMGVSTLELSNGARYNFHPHQIDPNTGDDSFIGHWIVARGYDNYVNTALFADPAANASGLSSDWNSAQPYFSYTTNNFQRFLAGHGISYYR